MQFSVLSCWWKADFKLSEASGSPFVVRNPMSATAWQATHRSACGTAQGCVAGKTIGGEVGMGRYQAYRG